MRRRWNSAPHAFNQTSILWDISIYLSISLPPPLFLDLWGTGIMLGNTQRVTLIVFTWFLHKKQSQPNKDYLCMMHESMSGWAYARK
jgi:hypothetical protein